MITFMGIINIPRVNIFAKHFVRKDAQERFVQILPVFKCMQRSPCPAYIHDSG